MTEQEFKDYIADEVLLAVKGEMQWEFTKVPEPVTKRYQWLALPPAVSTTTLNLMNEAGVDLPNGTVVNREGGGTVTLDEPLFEESTQMKVTVATNTGGTFYYDKIELPNYTFQSVRAYNAIVNETLLRLEVTDISTVNERKLRDYGKREAWRHLMWATVADYSYSSQTAGIERSSLHQRAKEMFLSEDNYVKTNYGEVATRVPVTSVSKKINGVWR